MDHQVHMQSHLCCELRDGVPARLLRPDRGPAAHHEREWNRTPHAIFSLRQSGSCFGSGTTAYRLLGTIAADREERKARQEVLTAWQWVICVRQGL